MKATIIIDMDNAAFADGYNGDELARILHKLASGQRGIRLQPSDGEALYDVNGNKIGDLDIIE